jgi:hypothetical protein
LEQALTKVFFALRQGASNRGVVGGEVDVIEVRGNWLVHEASIARIA